MKISNLDDLRLILEEAGLSLGATIFPEVLFDDHCPCCPPDPDGERDLEECPNWNAIWNDTLDDWDNSIRWAGHYYLDDWKTLDEYSSWAEPDYLDDFAEYINGGIILQAIDDMVEDKTGHKVYRGETKLFIDEGYPTVSGCPEAYPHIGPVITKCVAPRATLHYIEDIDDLMKWLTPAMRSLKLDELGI